MCVLFMKMPLNGAIAQQRVMNVHPTPVAEWPLKKLRSQCDRMAELVREHDVALLVLVPWWEFEVPAMEFHAYGCPLIEEAYCTTMMNVHERRTWIFLDELVSVRRNILVFGRPLDAARLPAMPGRTVEHLDKTLLLIKGNTETVAAVLTTLGVELSGHGL